MSGDAAGPGGGAASAGGAVLPEQGSQSSAADGWLTHPPQRDIRDQPGGAGIGKWRSLPTGVVMFNTTLPHAFCS